MLTAVVPAGLLPARSGELAHGCEVGSIVCHEPERSVEAQDPAGLVEELRVNKPPLGVTPLWPGVWKRNVENGHTGIGNMLAEALRSLPGQGMGVREFVPRNFGKAPLDACGLAFDAKKVAVGMQPGHANQEDPSVTSKIDLERGCVLCQPVSRKGCGRLHNHNWRRFLVFFSFHLRSSPR